MTTDTRPRYVRPPSVADYERMTQRARMSAAHLMADHIARIEKKREKYRAPTAPVRRPDDYTPEQTRELATVLLVRYQRTYNDPPSLKVARLTDAVTEAYGGHP